MTGPDSNRESPRSIAFGHFEVLEELGTGGFGYVTRCIDRRTGAEVALKELHQLSPNALLGLKNEFRLLTEIDHPNIARTYELIEHDGAWALVLEYVPGTDFFSWARSTSSSTGYDDAKVRDGLVQLVSGLEALHAHGILHRDVKPQNVRVTPDGRVVLLDFGMAAVRSPRPGLDTVLPGGSAAYMAPEALGADLLAASDWYSVGTLVYEVLTGRLPFEGNNIQVMLDKQRKRPAPPSEHCRDIPEDLNRLCLGLLATKVEDRLEGSAVLAALDRPTIANSQSDRSQVFVGRERELAVLEKALALAQRGSTSVVLVRGESGIGKTALVQHFAESCAGRKPAPLVFRGRCHVAEQIGYKSFDGIVDQLSAVLRGMDDRACRALLPANAALLPALFPMLSSVKAIDLLSWQPSPRTDRYLAFRSFSQLLTNLGQTQAAILAIDDLQWADESSLLLLRHLSEAPGGRLCIVATLRSDGDLDARQQLLMSSITSLPNVTTLELTGLDASTSHLLSRRLRKQGDGTPVDDLVREAGGHPMFLTELAQDASHGQGARRSGRLADFIERRITALEPNAQGMLHLLCVGAAPLSLTHLTDALTVSPETARDLANHLSALRLAQSARHGELLVYHDRIREVALAGLSESERHTLHRRVAKALARSAKSEPGRIAYHFLEAKETALALPLLERAAGAAMTGGAFERAAAYYTQLLSLAGTFYPPETLHTFRLDLADALASAGRCAESARVLLDALPEADESQAAELSIRAAERLLQAGQVQEGMSTARIAFGLRGLPWRTSFPSAMVHLFWNRWRFGRLLDGADPEPAEGADDLKLDALRRLATPMVWADLIRWSEIQTRYSYLSLRSGIPEHMAFALCGALSVRAMDTPDDARSEQLLTRARAWRVRSDSKHLLALEQYHTGLAATFSGDFRAAEADLTTSERTLFTDCPGAQWDLVNARSVLLSVWNTRGEYEKHGRIAQQFIEEARLRGDKFAEAAYAVSGLGCLRHIRADFAAEARREIDLAMTPWRTASIGLQQFVEFVALEEVEAYELASRGQSQSDSTHAQNLARLERSFISRMPFLRATLTSSRLRGALARACLAPGDVAARKVLHTLHRRLRNTTGAIARANYTYYAAQIAWLERRHDDAANLANAARIAFEKMDMFDQRLAGLLHAKATRAPEAESREQHLLEDLSTRGWVRPDWGLRALLPATCLEV